MIYIGTGLTGPYSVIQWRCQCSAELGWPSHSMCSSPHWQVGQSWFREKLSLANREQRLSRWADFAKNCLTRIGSKVLPRFRQKYHALGRQKNGVQHATTIYPIPRYTRPRYIGLTLYPLRWSGGIIILNEHSFWNRICHLVAIAGATLLVPCHVVKSLQLLWRSGTCRWNLRVPDLQTSCCDLNETWANL